MRVLITGGAGFIGRALTKKLTAGGHSVRILTRRRLSSVSVDGAECVQGRYDDTDSLKQAADGCSAVFHLGAALFARSREEFERANVLSTRNLAQACAATKPEKFIYVSSLAAGGASPDTDRPRKETNPDCPVSYYGMTKLAAEKELKALDQRTSTVIIRPPIVYGRNDFASGQIEKWIRRGIMVSPSQPETAFSFVYIDDLTDALCAALTAGQLGGGTFYVGEDKSCSWRDFIFSVADAARVKRPLLLSLPPALMTAAGFCYEKISSLCGAEPILNRDKAREAAAGHWICSSSAWGDKMPGWKWTPLAEGIKKTFGPE